jgi:hypothetical protein
MKYLSRWDLLSCPDKIILSGNCLGNFNGGYLSESKRPERESYDSPIYSAEFKISCFTSCSLYALMVWCIYTGKNLSLTFRTVFLFILSYLLLGSTAHVGPWPPEQTILLY